MRVRPWQSLLGSLVLHALLVLLAVGLADRQRETEPEPEPGPAVATRAVDLLYVPPPPAAEAPPRAPEPEPEPPPQPEPEPAQRTPPPPPAPAMPPTPRVPEHDEPAGTPAANERPAPRSPEEQGPEGDENGGADARTGAPTMVATMESEARRIFGSRRRTAGTRAGPEATAGLPVYIPESVNRCAPKPPTPEQRAELASISGQVTTPSGVPLPGAHLQIVGTGHATFADDRGLYTLTFAKYLVDECRSQVVRITAPGYKARTVLLAMGTGSNNVMLDRR